jgi:hypothetical protein
MPNDALWIVDLRGAASVAFGAALSRYSSTRIAPVMTFNNWPAENEVVPAEQTLAALATMAPKQAGTTTAGERSIPVFLLDAWRLALREKSPDPEAVDNRYMLLASDFPDAATLLRMGFTRIIYVVEDRRAATTEEDDLHQLALDYQAAGIHLSMVDLRTLSGLGGSERWVATPEWEAWCDDWSYPVEFRTTIFDDPEFYARARGGFGGVRAAPPEARGYTPAHAMHGGIASQPPGGVHVSGAPHGAYGGSAGGYSSMPAGSYPGSGGSGRSYSGASPHVTGSGG